jgi:hypothetical protein
MSEIGAWVVKATGATLVAERREAVIKREK